MFFNTAGLVFFLSRKHFTIFDFFKEFFWFYAEFIACAFQNKFNLYILRALGISCKTFTEPYWEKDEWVVMFMYGECNKRAIESDFAAVKSLSMFMVLFLYQVTIWMFILTISMITSPVPTFKDSELCRRLDVGCF